MLLCERCRGQIGAPEADARFPFTAYGLAGGALGTLAAIATGTVILVPAGLIAGILAGACKCEGCGAEVNEGEPTFHMMETGQDEGGAPVFAASRPGRERSPTTEDAVFGAAPSARPQQGPRQAAPRVPRTPEPDSLSDGEATAGAEKPLKYCFDVFSESLVPVGPVGQEGPTDVTSTITIGPGFDLGGAQVAGGEVPAASALPPNHMSDPFAPVPSAFDPGPAEPSPVSFGEEIA